MADTIETDPLYIGLTRPALILGVPMLFLGINFGITAVIYIGVQGLMAKLWALALVSLPLHVLGAVATDRDTQWMAVLYTAIAKTSPTPNRGFWLCNSYRP